MSPIFELEMNLKGTRFEKNPQLLSFTPFVDNIVIQMGENKSIVTLKTSDIPQARVDTVKEVLEELGLNPKLKEI